MQPILNAPLAPFTSFAVGGPAQQLYNCASSAELLSALAEPAEQRWLLGYGANVLVSDAGLPGSVLLVRGGSVTTLDDGTTVVADAGVWWDDLVQYALAAHLWGLELTSGVPGSVGAAVVGNIAAYGQAVSDTLDWVEIFDPTTAQTRQLEPAELQLSYRSSAFQTESLRSYVILRAAFSLGTAQTSEVSYQKALDVAAELGSDLASLPGRRQAILETRKRAGSLWDYRTGGQQAHTAGSFFRNPLVSGAIAEQLMSFDETGKNLEQLKQMNLVHSGEQKRVSAAHVLLAAGFTRGQTWGAVRLHPDHILKLENTGGATAQAIYDVARTIQQTVQEKLGITLVPEVRFLGEFNN